MKSGQVLTTIGDYDIGREDDGTCYIENTRLPEEEDYFLRFTSRAFPDNDVPYMTSLLKRCEE